MNPPDRYSGVYALGIETAFSTVSVCLFDPTLQQVVSLEELSLVKGHAEALPLLIAEVLTQAEKEKSAIKEICVSVGPGSFTGTRIGISAAKALAAVRNIPIYGISTTTAFAAPYLGAGVPVVSIIDAGNSRVYFEFFDAFGQRTYDLSVSEIAEAVRILPFHEVIVTGVGSETFLREATARGIHVRPEGREDSPGADEIARAIALRKVEPLPPVPLYLRNQYQDSKKGLL